MKLRFKEQPAQESKDAGFFEAIQNTVLSEPM
jgi:hypothetical protein